jgi:F-type H+-transporting ATPase subunit b
MPQFDTTTFAGQIFWLVLSFGLLYFLVSRVILPKFISIVDHREDRISHDIRAAKDLQKEIDYLQAKVAETKRKAIREVTELYDKEKNDVEASLRKEFLDLKHQIHDQHERFILDLEGRQQALKESFVTEAAQIINDTLHKVVGGSVALSEITSVAESVSKNLSSGVRV